ncbi:hypothetical protein P7C71_g589, partial [Lecanoromycetidae sp. Uapishka_2]
MKTTAHTLPQIRVSDIDLLTDWDFEHVKALGGSIPGYRSSATFLTTLRSNLHLSVSDLSPYNSVVSTPTTAAFSTTLLTHPNPSPFSISTTIAPSAYHVPELEPEPEPEPLPVLTTIVAPPEQVDDRNAALRLIADSISEQRLSSAKAAMLHPASLAATVLVTVMMAQSCSLPILAILMATLTISGLAMLYWITMDYGTIAQSINWDWLDSGKKNGHGKGEDPIVVVSRWGHEIIAALVLRVAKRERKGYVKAWTVDSSYRGNGVGSGLLEEGVRVAWGKGARCVVFEREHANFHRVLPSMFNRNLDNQEARAKALLAEMVADIKREKSSR